MTDKNTAPIGRRSPTRRSRARTCRGTRPRASRSSRSTPPRMRRADPGLPGFAPFTRGLHATMYASQPWTIRQYAGFSTAEDSNAFYRRNLAAGQKGLSVAFDLATHRGYDSDHPRVAGDVGMAGVAIDSIYDMRTLFDGIPLDQMSRVDDHERRGAAGAGALHRRGRGAGRAAGEARRAPSRTTSSKSSWSATPTSIRPSPRCGSSPTSSPTPSAKMPKFNSISISGYHMQEAGATAGPRARLHARRRRRIRARRRRRRARHRRVRAAAVVLLGDRHELLHGGRQAARRARCCGPKLMKQFDAEGPEVAVAAHALPDLGLVADRAGRRSTTSSRTAIEAMAATQGHTQSLHTNALDEALALPTDFSARIARNTQLFLQQESGTTAHHRPAGAARYYVERLTARARRRRPGATSRRSRRSAAWPRRSRPACPSCASRRPPPRTQARIDAGEQSIVGVNKYRPDRRSADRRARRSTTPRCARLQIAQARSGCARERDRRRSQAALDALTRRRRDGNGNLLALAVDAARAKAHRRRDFRRAGEGLRPPPRRDPSRHAASTSARPARWPTAVAQVQALVDGVRGRRGPPAAHPGRQDGPGRPRPRRRR